MSEEITVIGGKCSLIGCVHFDTCHATEGEQKKDMIPDLRLLVVLAITPDPSNKGSTIEVKCRDYGM